jgi:hypothetical protein
MTKLTCYRGTGCRRTKRHIDFADDTLQRKPKSHVTPELLGETALNQARAEPSLTWLSHQGASAFCPT